MNNIVTDDNNYSSIHSEIVKLLEGARRAAARSVNALMTATYWEIGRRIVEFEQGGAERAGYGEALIESLSQDLARQFGRGFSRQNLQQMRLFYQAWPMHHIRQTVSGELAPLQISQTPSAISNDLSALAQTFPLPWSAYVRLLSVKNEMARNFYETEALRCGWSVRQLDRQINSQFYERTALSQIKAATLLIRHSREGGTKARSALNARRAARRASVASNPVIRAR